MAETGTRGGTHEQHVKAGEQSHKNTPSSASKGGHSGEHDKSETAHGSHTQGGTHEQHVNAGKQSHKNG